MRFDDAATYNDAEDLKIAVNAAIVLERDDPLLNRRFILAQIYSAAISRHAPARCARPSQKCS